MKGRSQAEVEKVVPYGRSKVVQASVGRAGRYRSVRPSGLVVGELMTMCLAGISTTWSGDWIGERTASKGGEGFAAAGNGEKGKAG
jgi:hypothetical protein